MNKYISREAVVRYLKEYSEKECNSNSPYGMITSSVLNKAERAISELPAADVQPARFARWIDLDNRILCSGCGAGYDDSDEVKQNTYIFCPNCGARMDGDTNG